ncbi:MAG: hypothetical protein AAF318_13770 [Pseudomonadota bacterium]
MARLLIVLCLMAMAACSKPFDAVTPAALPRTTYAAMDCGALNRELRLLQLSLRREALHQRQAQTLDAVGVIAIQAPVGRLLDMDREAEIAALKGRRQIAQLTHMEKHC